MFSTKNLLINILLLFIFFSLFTPTISLCFDQDSIYVWSNISSVSTSISPSATEQEVNDNSLER